MCRLLVAAIEEQQLHPSRIGREQRKVHAITLHGGSQRVRMARQNLYGIVHGHLRFSSHMLCCESCM